MYSGLTKSYWLVALLCRSSLLINNFDLEIHLGIFKTQAGESLDDLNPGNTGIESFQVLTTLLSKSSQGLKALGRKDILITKLKASSSTILFSSSLCFLSRRLWRLFLTFLINQEISLCSNCWLSFGSSCYDVLSVYFFFRINLHVLWYLFTWWIVFSFPLCFLFSFLCCFWFLRFSFDITSNRFDFWRFFFDFLN